MHVKKGDNVIVIAGKEKGKKAVVARVLPAQDKVVLEGLNMVKKHMRPKKQGEKGGIVSIPQPIHVSNVKLADKKKKEVKVVKEKKATAKKVTKAK
ncbi:MAG: large subunit ribosomal protein [Patescibacteria group bacterium]|nr:large subunit ribosomal protein [Patescibacteria group bacterium]